jgi:hypothetical protein
MFREQLGHMTSLLVNSDRLSKAEAVIRLLRTGSESIKNKIRAAGHVGGTPEQAQRTGSAGRSTPYWPAPPQRRKAQEEYCKYNSAASCWFVLNRGSCSKKHLGDALSHGVQLEKKPFLFKTVGNTQTKPAKASKPAVEDAQAGITKNE